LILKPRTRRVVQACLYEGIAIAVVAPLIVWLFQHPAPSALLLAALMSAIALAWNYGFNLLFERWESGQPIRGRPWRLRVLHGLGFEGGLTLMLVPLLAMWLQISLWQAFLAELGLLVFFLVYTMLFTWAFDRVFGLPLSAQAGGKG